MVDQREALAVTTQIKMADEDIIEKVLELYQICKSRGDRASLFMETMNGKDITVNFTIKCPAGPPPAGTSSSARRRWKTPSQIRRDKERSFSIFLRYLSFFILNNQIKIGIT